MLLLVRRRRRLQRGDVSLMTSTAKLPAWAARHMKKALLIANQMTVAAIIIALALIASGFLFGGIYESRIGFRGAVIYRTNRFTGSISGCFLNGVCIQIPDTKPTIESAVVSPSNPTAPVAVKRSMRIGNHDYPMTPDGVPIVPESDFLPVPDGTPASPVGGPSLAQY